MAKPKSATKSASSSTARPSRSPMSRRTRRCSTICGCAARCAAPRKAAPRATAAPAPCWSAGCRGGGLVYEGVNACIRFLGSLDGCHVVTVEHLRGATATLHPVQQAMVDFHGSQCGFCTPGFVMSLYALWMRNAGPDPTREIEKALQGNLCRCTGYEAIVRAAMAICQLRQAPRSDPLAVERKAVAARLAALRRRQPRRDRRGRAAADGAGDRSTISPTVLDAEPDGDDRRRLDRCRALGHQVSCATFRRPSSSAISTS